MPHPLGGVGESYPLGILNLLMRSRYADTEDCLTLANTGSFHWLVMGGLGWVGLGWAAELLDTDLDRGPLVSLFGGMGALVLLMGGLFAGARLICPAPFAFRLAAIFWGDGSDESLEYV